MSNFSTITITLPNTPVPFQNQKNPTPEAHLCKKVFSFVTARIFFCSSAVETQPSLERKARAATGFKLNYNKVSLSKLSFICNKFNIL